MIMSTKNQTVVDMKGIEFVFLAIGAVIGSFVRFKITESPLILGVIPINVLLVNILGSFILGLFIVVSNQWNLEGRYSLLVAVGFCGTLTTMSYFALDSSNLLDNGHYLGLAVHIAANVGLSICALIIGRQLMSAILT